jgi:predicted alpha-1,2-mannosidase
MVQPGPDNTEGGWDFTSGYQFHAPRILGFSQTRASGTGCDELGDVLLQPLAERRTSDFGSDYDKSSETARPGYYAVTLRRNGARVELTSTVRVALHRYTYSHGGRVYVVADFQHGLTSGYGGPRVTASDVKPGNDRIEGWLRATAWTARTVAFSVVFDHPIAEVTVLPAAKGELAPRYLLAFDLREGKQLQVKAAVTSTDVDGARRNLEEVPGWNFDAVARASNEEWNTLLGRVELTAPETQKRIFYTALYHNLLHPSVISDVDGRYRGPDGKIASSGKRTHYSTISLWDVFRAGLPLDALVVPERMNDFVETLLGDGDAQGYLPLWPIWGAETDTMIGNPALPVIATAWADGFRGFDGKRALAAMVHASTVDHTLSDNTTSGWAIYDRYGYFPIDKVSGEAVSRTLEAGIGDDATARMAGMLGDKAIESRFTRRARSWQALMDPETHLARGRDSLGAWRTPFDPLAITSPLNNPGDYTEASAWQYTWAPALHDTDGLVAAMGGRAGFTSMLDRFFAQPNHGINKFLGQEALIGQYAHGDEPSHHVAWLYAFSDNPCRGQERVRQIATSFYHDAPDGMIGNDDAGQMSAWYVFATMGFYPVEPASGQYVLAAPLASRVSIRVPGRKPLVIESNGATGTQPCVSSVSFDGTAVDGPRIDHLRLAAGGTLRFNAN